MSDKPIINLELSELPRKSKTPNNNLEKIF